ncbi:UNVERIFIED_CONTAM: Dual specificity protein kinase YAK1 [Sesamum radiatum]|uniref:Dual specificity protein kinase YAK1 n=1 Tax=Sesamum radiatum TaxID=300843 RepID=A0AAW2KCC2_SESRA
MFPSSRKFPEEKDLLRAFSSSLCRNSQGGPDTILYPQLRESKKPSVGKEYFNHMNLEAIVTKYPIGRIWQKELLKESQVRLALIDFLRGLVEFDPAKRWSPLQASKHPFVTGEPFTCPYKPVPETPHMPVSQNVKVDHHPAGGHWFAAGLSPNISGRNRGVMPNSPHYQLMSYVHPGSYGSLGSHGSYNEGLGLGSSYGSYGDSSNFHAFYSPAGPSGMNIYAQSGISILGNSPDTSASCNYHMGMESVLALEILHLCHLVLVLHNLLLLAPIVKFQLVHQDNMALLLL